MHYYIFPKRTQNTQNSRSGETYPFGIWTQCVQIWKNMETRIMTSRDINQFLFTGGHWDTRIATSIIRSSYDRWGLALFGLQRSVCLVTAQDGISCTDDKWPRCVIEAHLGQHHPLHSKKLCGRWRLTGMRPMLGGRCWR